MFRHMIIYNKEFFIHLFINYYLLVFEVRRGAGARTNV